MVQGRMIRAALFALALVAGSVQAETLALQFRGAKLADVVEGIIKGVLERDYVIAGDVPLQGMVTLNIKAVDKSQVLDLLKGVAGSHGVSITDRGGVLYVERQGAVLPASDEPQKGLAQVVPNGVSRQFGMMGMDRSNYEPRAYFPKYRSVEFLTLAVQAAGGSVVQSNQGQSGQMQFQVPGMGQQSGANAQVRRDALVYSAPPELVKKIERLVEQLDVPMIAVQLRAAVLEISNTSEEVRSLSGVLSLLGGRLGISLGAGIQQAGNAISIQKTSLQAVLSAVDGDSRFRYLSEPTLRVLDGETARLVVGQDVPVRGAVTYDKNGNSLQSIEYRTAGLVLEVAPKVLSGVVQLKINQQISTPTTTTTSGIDSPTMMRREATTMVQADDGELIALAGLDEDRQNGSNSGLSFLPSWLNSKSASRSRSQILILMEVKKVPVAAI